LLVCLGASGVYAQDVYNSSGGIKGYRHKQQKKGYDPAKLVVGATINAAYSGDYANFGIGPTVGYKFTPDLSAGIGLGYQYNQAPDFYVVANPVTGEYPALKESILYPGIWAKYNVWHNLFIEANFEYNIIKITGYSVQYDTLGNPYNTKSSFTSNVPSLLLGAGIKSPLGGNVSGFVEILYDVLQQDYSPYYKEFPVIRVGITVGL